MNQDLEYRSDARTSGPSMNEHHDPACIPQQMSCLLRSLKDLGWRKSAVKSEAESCLSARRYDEYLKEIQRKNRAYTEPALQWCEQPPIFQSHTKQNIAELSAHRVAEPFSPNFSKSPNGRDQNRSFDRIFFASNTAHSAVPKVLSLHCSPFLKSAISMKDTTSSTWQRLDSSTRSPLPLLRSNQYTVQMNRAQNAVHKDLLKPVYQGSNLSQVTGSPAKQSKNNATGSKASHSRHGNALETQQDVPSESTLEVNRKSVSKELIISILSASWFPPIESQRKELHCVMTASSAKQVLKR